MGACTGPDLETRFLVNVQRDVAYDKYGVYIAVRDKGIVHVPEHPITWIPLQDSMMTAPMFRLGQGDLQHLMDELWHVGIRPSEGTGSAGALAATQAHLKDLQSIISKLMEHHWG